MHLLRNCFRQSVTVSLVALLLMACDKRMGDGAAPLKISIAKKIATSNDFTILQAAVIKTGLQPLLDSPGTFTVFAPTNEVMIASGLTLEQINLMPTKQLEKLIKYQILPTRLFLDDFKLGVYYNEISIGGDSSFVTRNTQGLFVNGIKVIRTDILQSNGIIHIPSKLTLPAEGDLLEVVAIDTSLSFFNAALQKTSKGGTDLMNALVCGCKFTLFAPNNQAFKLAGYPTIASSDSADYKKMVALLSYHITKERVFSSDWLQSAQVHMINGRQINFMVNGNDYMVKGDSNLMPIKVIKHNTMATHGVVHTIERIIE